MKKLSLVVLLLVTQQCLADFRFNVGKRQFIIFDNTIVDASTDKLPYTRVFRFKANKDTYIGVYECNNNILLMGIPNTPHRDCLLTPPNSFGRILGDYVCTYPVKARRWKLIDEVD